MPSSSLLGALSYTTRGDASRPSLVFLHAFPLNAAMWNEQLEKFSSEYYCVAVDLPGFGDTPLVESSFTFEAYAESFLELMESLKIERATWIGLSMGGYLALRALELAPERCSRLVLADTKSSPDDDATRLKRFKAIKDLRANVEAFLQTQWTALTAPQSAQDKKAFEFFSRQALRNSKGGVQAALVALTTRTDTTASLSRIGVPTLILVGAEDKVTPVASAQALHSQISGSVLSVLPGCGHLSNLEAPAAFNQALEKFLASTPS